MPVATQAPTIVPTGRRATRRRRRRVREVVVEVGVDIVALVEPTGEAIESTAAAASPCGDRGTGSLAPAARGIGHRPARRSAPGMVLDEVVDAGAAPADHGAATSSCRPGRGSRPPWRPAAGGLGRTRRGRECCHRAGWTGWDEGESRRNELDGGWSGQEVASRNSCGEAEPAELATAYTDRAAARPTSRPSRPAAGGRRCC